MTGDQAQRNHSMKKQNTCVNNHESAASTASPDTSTPPDTSTAVTELGCSFTRVTKNGKPALLACINIQAQTSATETLSSLMHHAQELNIRLPFLRVSVRVSHESKAERNTTERNTQESYLFVLHGLSSRSITARNISDFLNRLTHDFKIFSAYAEAHNIQIQPNLENSAVKPFA